MKAVLQALQALQEVDRDLFRIDAELRRLPLERAQRQAELERIEQRIGEHQGEVLRHRVRIKEIEDLTSTQRARIRKLESEAATSRQNVALVVAFQHEIRGLRREMGTLEDEALMLLERIETLEAEVKQQQARLSAERAVFEQLRANIEREIEAAGARRRSLSEARARATATEIPPEALGAYTRLLAAREGQALAQLDGKLCQACYMEIPTNLVVRVARGVELIPCPSCDRILYLR